MPTSGFILNTDPSLLVLVKKKKTQKKRRLVCSFRLPKSIRTSKAECLSDFLTLSERLAAAIAGTTLDSGKDRNEGGRNESYSDYSGEDERGSTGSEGSTAAAEHSRDSSNVRSDSPELLEGNATFQYPDFITFIRHKGSNDERILFIHEVKKNSLAFQRNTTKTNVKKILDNVYHHMLGQIVKQAQHAFASYPSQDIINVMCIVGVYHHLVIFLREKTPAIDEYTTAKLVRIPHKRFQWEGMYKEDGNDVSPAFKRSYTLALKDSIVVE